MKILVVEDEVPYLKLLQGQLSKRGYQVAVATNGQEGLEMVRHDHPDLILLDITMPVMDGVTMLDQLRADPIGKTAKVIVLANSEPDDKIIGEMIRTRPLYYFVKSNTILNDLLLKVKEVLPNKP